MVLFTAQQGFNEININQHNQSRNYAEATEALDQGSAPKPPQKKSQIKKFYLVKLKTKQKRFIISSFL